MPRVAIRGTRASKTRGKSYQGERKEEEERIYCVATAASARRYTKAGIHLVDYDRRILVSIPCAPVSTKLREWFSSFTGIPSSITRQRWKRPLSKSGLLEATNCSFFSNDRRRRSPPVHGRFYSIVRDLKCPLETDERPNDRTLPSFDSWNFPRARRWMEIRIKYDYWENCDGGSATEIVFTGRIARHDTHAYVHEPGDRIFHYLGHSFRRSFLGSNEDAHLGALINSSHESPRLFHPFDPPPRPRNGNYRVLFWFGKNTEISGRRANDYAGNLFADRAIEHTVRSTFLELFSPFFNRTAR